MSVSSRLQVSFMYAAILALPYVGCGGKITSTQDAADCFSDPQVIALAEAVGKDDLPQIDRLVADGVDVNGQGKDGVNPLLWATKGGNKASFRRLLEHGADPNVRIRQLVSVTHAAARSEDSSEWLEMVLKHGGNANLVISKDLETPIFHAISSRRKENLDLLIRAGADVNHRNGIGVTPMIFAAGRNWYDSVYYLLQAGADYRIQDNNEYDLACTVVDTSADPGSDGERWRQKVVEFLERKGVDLVAAKEKCKRLDNRPPPQIDELK